MTNQSEHRQTPKPNSETSETPTSAAQASPEARDRHRIGHLNERPLEDEDADPVGSPGEEAEAPLEHVERAAEQVPKPATEPAERTGELLQRELELTEAGVTSPEEAPQQSR